MVSATVMVVLASTMATHHGITSMVIMATIHDGMPLIITIRIIPPGGHITDTTTIRIPMTTGTTVMQAMITMIAVTVMMNMMIATTAVAGMAIQTDTTQHLSVDMYLQRHPGIQATGVW